jgi:hypothetical protein
MTYSTAKLKICGDKASPCGKKKLAVQNEASNNSISNYLSMKNIGEMEKQLSLAAQEATFAYHTAVHNHSFKSMDCTTTIVRKLFNDNLHVQKQNAEQ